MTPFVLAGCNFQKETEIARPVYAKQQSPNSRASSQSDSSPPKAVKVQWVFSSLIGNVGKKIKNVN